MSASEDKQRIKDDEYHLRTPELNSLTLKAASRPENECLWVARKNSSGLYDSESGSSVWRQ